MKDNASLASVIFSDSSYPYETTLDCLFLWLDISTKIVVPTYFFLLFPEVVESFLAGESIVVV